MDSIIWSALFDFFVFNTNDKRVAINRTQVNYAHFLFDIGVVEEEEDESYKLVVNFVGSEKAIEFDVDPDASKIDDDEEGYGSQLQNLFVHIDGNSADDDEIVWFDDEDGERVYLRTKQISSIEVPLICCEPDLWRSCMDGLEDRREAANLESADANNEGDKG